MSAERMNRAVKILFGWGKGLALILLLVVMMMWLSGAFVDKVEPGPPADLPRPSGLKTAKVEHRVFPLFLEQVGNLRAMTEARVSSRIMAQVKEVLVHERDHVLGGDDAVDRPTLMARLDDRDIRARLRQARSRVTAMKRAMEAAGEKMGAARAQVEAALANEKRALADFKRYEDLHRRRAATGQQLQNARAQKEVAQANLSAARREVKAAQREIERIKAEMAQAEAAVSAARVMLTYAEIRAPFTGLVVKKMVEVGDMAIPGQPMFLLEIPCRPELRAFVSDSLIPRLRVGQELNVHIDALGRDFTGSIREIAPKSDPATRTVVVKVSLPPDVDLVNGLFGRLAVPYGQYEALVVPVGAIRKVGQLNLVEVLDPEGYPHRRFVTLGRRHKGLVVVLSGLKEGEEVVIP